MFKRSRTIWSLRWPLAALSVAQTASADGDRRGRPRAITAAFRSRSRPTRASSTRRAAGNTEFDDYWQPHEIDRAVRKLGRAVQARSVIGLSNRGRPIYSVRTGHGRKVVFVQAGIHANELTGTTAVMNLLEDLDDNVQAQPRDPRPVTLVFIPMLNVDGAVHYQRENDQTWAETEQRFPQLAGRPPAFYHQDAGPALLERPARRGLRPQPRLQPELQLRPAARAPARQRRRPRPEPDARVEGLAGPVRLARA